MTLPRTARGIVNSVFRHQWRFIGTFCLVVAMAVAAVLVIKPAYRSEALLLVKFNGRTTSTDAVAGAAIQAQASERREVMNSQAQILQSRDLLREVVGGVGVARIYPNLVEDASEGDPIEDKATERLGRDLAIEPTKESNIMQVSVMNRDPQVAAEVLKDVVARFRARQAEVFLNPQSTFLREQLDEARGQLATSQAAVEAFKSESGISSLDEERTLLLRLRAEVRNNLAQLGARRSEAESRTKMLTDSLKRLPATIQLSDENDRFQAIDDARGRLTELRAREAEMATNYRDDSVALRSLRTQIQFAEKDLAERSKESLARVRTGPNPVQQQVQADLYRAGAEAAAASAAIAPLERQIAEVEARLASLDANQGKLQDLMLQQQVDEESFRSILQRSEDARASEALQRQQVTSVVVVQQPTVPSKPAKPRVLIILALGIMAGTAIAFVVCLIRELADQTFSLPEQVTGVLKLPVLASFAVSPALEPRSVK
jgi:uncharacterized protein involved in exopolysaccharide biosynthesis